MSCDTGSPSSTTFEVHGGSESLNVVHVCASLESSKYDLLILSMTGVYLLTGTKGSSSPGIEE